MSRQSTSLLDVHLRLMSMLPVRTHYCSSHHDRMQGRSIGAQLPKHMLIEYARLRDLGFTRREIIKAMGIGTLTYRRLRIAVTSKDAPE